MSSAMKIGIAAVVVFLMGGGAALWHVSRDDELVRSGESAGRDAPMLEKAEAEPAIAEREDENAPSGKSAALVPLDTPIAAGKASVSGVLRFRNGTPVAGRQVSLSGSPAKIVETDDQGRFHIHGEWVYERNLAFRGPNGYSLAIGTVKLKADKRVEVDFVLDAGFDLAATVTRSEDGGPISGASVRIYRDDAGPDEQQAEWGWVDTDTGGQFRFRHAPGGEYRLHVVHAGHEAFTKWIRLEGDLSLPIELNEARMLVVKFRNLPPEWRGAKVHLSLSEMGGQSLYLDFEESIDDHDEIRVDAPPPGRYRVELIPGGSPLPRLRYGEYIVTRKRVEPIVFDLPTGARIVGTVTRPDGTPLEKARIEVEAGEIYGRTDADGNFELPFVPKGPNRLLLGSARGTRLAVAHVDVPEHGALRVDVRLRGTATLRGRFVTDAPDWSRTIHLHRKGEEQAIALCRPEGAGFFEIPYLDAGHYELRAWAKDADWLKRPLFLEEGANLDLGEVEAAAFPSFPVRVMVPAGSEMPTTFMVSFHSKDGKRFHRGRMKLKRDGTGFLRGLPEDDGTLQFEASGFALVRRPLTLHKEMPRIEFALKAAPVKLNVAFELAGNDGGPVPRLVVLVAKGRGGTPDGSAFLSFPQGPTRGRLSNLPAGEYTLWIRIDGYKPKDVDVVLAAADQDPIRVRLEKAE